MAPEMIPTENGDTAGRRVRLYCFPFAGAGPSLFHSWPTYLCERVDVHPVQLPGRERLVGEEPFTDVNVAAAAVASKIIDEATGRDRVAFFGHSMGAVLAYEVARLLRQEPKVEVVGIVVSGSPAPDRPRESRASGLSDEDFVSRVHELAGYRHPALDHLEMRELILPALRADVQMHEKYHASGSPISDVPIWAVRGIEDTLVSATDAERWRHFTGGAFEYIEITGSHMYLIGDDGLLSLMELIKRELGQARETEAST